MENMSKGQRYLVTFTGSGWEYFKIWIVNILLTILTVYIYSAWAKVRTKRYFYGNTLLDDSSFDYHAKPLQILLARLVAVGLLIIVVVSSIFYPLTQIVAGVLLFFIFPWAIWRSIKFNMRMTSYRNVRFGFDGSLWPMYLYQLVLPFVLYAAIGGIGYFLANALRDSLISPVIFVVGIGLLAVLFIWVMIFIHYRLTRYFINHYLYGKSRFSGELSLRYFFMTYLQAVLLGLGSLVMLSIVGLVVVLAMKPDTMGIAEWLQSYTESLGDDADVAKTSPASGAILASIVLFYAFIFVVGYFVTALFRVRIRNHVFNNATLDKRVSFDSTLSATGLWWVMVSNVFLTIFTLGLARPYTEIRMARYLAKLTAVISDTPLDEFVGEKRKEVSAFGEELGDVFDADMDVGF